MTKKHFIALANAIRVHNDNFPTRKFSAEQINVLARFCNEQNSQFNWNRWIGFCSPIQTTKKKI